MVPQVQVLVNLTGTQWKPVSLGHLHQDFWSFVDGCWEETVSCPVSLCIAHINMHIHIVYYCIYISYTYEYTYIYIYIQRFGENKNKASIRAQLLATFFLHDAGIVQPATQVSTWWQNA